MGMVENVAPNYDQFEPCFGLSFSLRRPRPFLANLVRAFLADHFFEKFNVDSSRNCDDNISRG